MEFDHSSSSCPQVVTPVRTGQGYVYEYPARYQKDIYDIPPSHATQGVCTSTQGGAGRAFLQGCEQREVHHVGMFHLKLAIQKPFPAMLFKLRFLDLLNQEILGLYLTKLLSLIILGQEM